MSPGTDPLAGLDRPRGDAGALSALGSSYVAGSEALGHTSRALIGMVGRLLAQAWSGQAAMACATACTRDAAMVATAADAYQIGGAALRRYASRLTAAQADYDDARRLADQAVAEELERERAHATAAAQGGLPNPLDLFWTSPLRVLARGRAEQAVLDARAAAQDAAKTLDQTMSAFKPKPPAAPPEQESHWYSPVVNFGKGAWDGVKDPVVMVGGLVGLHGDFTDNWSNLGRGIAYGVTHPLDFGKAAIGWEHLAKGEYSYWAGNLVPGAAAAFFTGGAAATVKGSDALVGVSRTGKRLEDMTEAEKAAVLARGEKLAAGSVGKDATPLDRLTADGLLDYSKYHDTELGNFRRIVSSGEVTLTDDLWLANLHDSSVPLSQGRSLKWATPVDEVLNHSRGGVLQRLALLPEWGARDGLSVIRVPEGASVHLTEGTAAAQLSKSTVTIAGKEFALPNPLGSRVGGGPQVLFKEFDRDWVVWTGKAPWPGRSEVLPHAMAVGGGTGLTVETTDALADISAEGR